MEVTINLVPDVDPILLMQDRMALAELKELKTQF